MTKLNQAMQNHNVTAIEVEQMCEIIGDLLEAFAEDTRKKEPYAINTIHKTEQASEVVKEFGCEIALYCDDEEESDVQEDESAWEDDSARCCADCPPEECTGHCMSCAYRSF